MKSYHSLTPYTKISSKQSKALNVRLETIELLDKNIGRTLSDINYSNIFFSLSLRQKEIKTKINKLNLLKFKSVCTPKETINRTKIQPTDWEKIFANDVTNKGLVFKIYNQLVTLNSIKTNNPINNEQKTYIGISPKKTYRWPRGTGRDIQHCQLLEKCKSKIQRDITSYQSEWLSSRNPQIINAEEGMERRELSYTVGGKINLYSHSNCMEVA